jgi:hypothetical protein
MGLDTACLRVDHTQIDHLQLPPVICLENYDFSFSFLSYDSKTEFV